MKATVALGIAMLTLSMPLAAAAQSPPPRTGDLEIQRKQKRSVVLPKPSADEVRRDADAAISEYAATLPSNVVRETSPVRPPSRPDLQRDVREGIQTQRLNDALRTR